MSTTPVPVFEASTGRRNASPPPPARQGATERRSSIVAEVGDRYDDIKAAKMEAFKAAKRVSTSRRGFEALARRLENDRMFQCDYDANDEQLQTDPGSLAGSDMMTDRVKLGRSRSAANLTLSERRHKYDPLSRAFGVHRHKATPVDPDMLALPDLKASEGYLNARVARSTYYTELQQLRDEVTAKSKAIYGLVNQSADAAAFIFDDATTRNGLLANPKADFQVTTKRLRGELTALLKSMRRLAEGVATRIVERESKMQKPATTACQTEATLLEALLEKEEHRLHERVAALEAENAKLKTRCSALERDVKDAVRKMTNAEEESTQLEKATDEKMRMLAGFVTDLQRSSYTAMHAVFRHRFKFAAACPNTFQSIAQPITKFVSSNLICINEAVRGHVALLKTFTDYFVSDANFGAKFFGCGAETPAAALAVGHRERAVAGHAGGPDRELDQFIAFADGLGVAVDADGAATNAARPRRASSAMPRRPSIVDNQLKRMEDWTEKQHKLWQERRVSLERTPVNVKLDPSLHPTPPSVPLVPPEPETFSRYQQAVDFGRPYVRRRP